MTIIKRNKYMTTLLFSAGILCVAVASIATVREMNSKPVAQVQKNPVKDPFSTEALAKMQKESLFTKTALSWLALIDAGKYDEGYKQMDNFNDIGGVGNFSKVLSDVRSPLGKVVNRTWKEEYRGGTSGGSSLRTAVFTTTFENQEKREEEVTFINSFPQNKGSWFIGKEEWQVMSYSLK